MGNFSTCPFKGLTKPSNSYANTSPVKGSAMKAHSVLQRTRRLKMKPTPKIALAALNDHMIKKAATLADRVILNLYPTERIGHAIKLIEEAQRTTHGKSRPTLSVMLYAYPLGDDEKGLDAARDLVAFYASVPAYSALFSSLGFIAEAKAMTEAWKAKDRDSVKRTVTRQMIDEIMVLGTIRRPKRTSKALP